MTTVLDVVERERSALVRIIAILDTQLDHLRDTGSDPNYRLLHDIVRYCCVYPPLSLFRLEDALFAHLAERDRDLQQLADELRRRHQRHAKLAEALYALLEGVLAGHMIPRQRLLKEAAAYVRLQREHMASRETRLLAATAAELDADELAALERHRDPDQPLVQPGVEEEFTRLREDIEKEALAA